MSARLLQFLMAVVLALCAALGLGVDAVASATAATAADDVPICGYNSDAHPVRLANSLGERGPPAAYDRAVTAYNAVDLWSHGDSARPDRATPPGAFAYDRLAPLVQVARGATTTKGAVGVADGNPRAFPDSSIAAKGADEAGALVRYDPEFASRNLLGQVGEGYARTPSGYTVSAHAAERIVYGAPGRSPTTLSRVDDILNNPTRSVMRPDGSIRVFQGKDWVAVRGSGPIHIITVMVR